MKRLLMIAGALGLTGCLTTMQEMREKEGKAPAVSAAQEKQAQETQRLQEYDEQFRALSGRIDVVENQLNQINAGVADKNNQESLGRKEVDAHLRALEEAIAKLEAQLKGLSEEIQDLKSAKAAPPPAASAGKSKDAFQSAEAAFNKKDYKQAIVDYEAYRKGYPKGKVYGVATLRIGQAFHELGMKDEAKSFFEEVVQKFPGSPEAKKASQRLKSMK